MSTADYEDARTPSPVVEVRNISKSFGGVVAVNDVSFDVYPGEILGLIGPNGCGKTTLFNCVLGQYAPDAGQVMLKGTDVSRWSPPQRAKHGLSRTFQLLQVFDSMSVRDNPIMAKQPHISTIFGRLFKSPDLGLSEEVDNVIGRFKLGHLADEIAINLSYGQKKLLDTAMAFIAEPEVAFLDEPAGGVNLTMLGDVENRIRELNEQDGVTFAIVEHNMEFIFGLAHRVIVMTEGSVLMVGTPDQVRNDPRVVEVYLGE
ncbi:MAG TPA: ABC transporter ATP-binding protein [Acidimicrobiia bacterium]